MYRGGEKCVDIPYLYNVWYCFRPSDEYDFITALFRLSITNFTFGITLYKCVVVRTYGGAFWSCYFGVQSPLANNLDGVGGKKLV